MKWKYHRNWTRIRVSQCTYCGRRWFFVEVPDDSYRTVTLWCNDPKLPKLDPDQPVNSDTNARVARPEDLKTLAEEEIRELPFSGTDVSASDFSVWNIHKISPHWLTEAALSVAGAYDEGGMEDTVLFAAFLLRAVRKEPTADSIREVIGNEKERKRLVERAKKPETGVAQRLRGVDWMVNLAVAFWDDPELTEEQAERRVRELESRLAETRSELERYGSMDKEERFVYTQGESLDNWRIHAERLEEELERIESIVKVNS